MAEYTLSPGQYLIPIPDDVAKPSIERYQMIRNGRRATVTLQFSFEVDPNLANDQESGIRNVTIVENKDYSLFNKEENPNATNQDLLKMYFRFNTTSIYLRGIDIKGNGIKVNHGS